MRGAREEALVECVGGAKHVGGHDGGREGGGVAGQGVLRQAVSGAVDGAVDGVSAPPAATGRTERLERSRTDRTLRDANHLPHMCMNEVRPTQVRIARTCTVSRRRSRRCVEAGTSMDGGTHQHQARQPSGAAQEDSWHRVVRKGSSSRSPCTPSPGWAPGGERLPQTQKQFCTSSGCLSNRVGSASGDGGGSC